MGAIRRFGIVVMMRVARILCFAPVASAVCIPIADPLERPCDRSKEFSLAGRKALIVTTSHDRLGDSNCTSCKPTGVTLTEADVPYWVFKDAGIEVDVASIKGGKIPEDGTTLTHWDCRLKNDKEAYGQFQNSLAISAVDFASYDIVYMAGGWGASWDLGTSDVLGEGVSKAFAAGKLLGSVCHGGLGFIRATKADGSLLVNGTRMTAVTDRQVKELASVLGWHEPMHPEEELRKRGAVYEAHHFVVDLPATDVVVDSLTSGGRIITGQNQNSACGVAQAMLARLEADSGEAFAWVPEACTSPIRPCYEGSYSDLKAVMRMDMINPCRKHATMKNGTCASFGYATHKSTPFGPIVKDPVFQKVTLWFPNSSDASEKTKGTYAWVPEGCAAPLRPCYEGNYTDLMLVKRLDIVNPCRKHADVKVGTCASFGYDTHKSTPFGPIVKDPVFRKVSLWFQEGNESSAVVV